MHLPTANTAGAADTGELYVGTAGWSIPRGREPMLEGSQLSRYSAILNACEINSSFHRSHRRSTYERWATSTPAHFRFAVKLPRLMTHEKALRGVAQPLDRFLDECAGLGDKLGPLLVQLPASMAFERRVASTFLDMLRRRVTGDIVIEPRHPSWLLSAADDLLVRSQVARVAADPARACGFERPGGWAEVVYLRLHGSPRTYWSRYLLAQVESYGAMLQQASACRRWCIFDNTASGAALDNALELKALVADG